LKVFAFPNPVLPIRIFFDPQILGSGKNVFDPISESLVTIFWVKNAEILCQFSVADLGSRIEKFRSRMEKSRFEVNILDPQHGP
jgi:hypothetical protein